VDGAVKLMDFGIAAPCDIAGIVCGTAMTPAYAAPEMFAEENNNPSSDFYSLGILVYELMTGQRPFVADSMAECARLHRTMTPPRLRERCHAPPEDIEQFVAAALIKDPKARLSAVRGCLKQWDRQQVPACVSRPPRI
jgi:serine/threonine-protein kinase